MPAEHRINFDYFFFLEYNLFFSVSEDLKGWPRITVLLTTLLCTAVFVHLYSFPASSTIGILRICQVLRKIDSFMFSLSLSLVIYDHLKWMCVCSKEELKFTNWCTNTLIYMQFWGFFRNASICINKPSFPNISVNKSSVHGCQKKAAE